MKLFSIALVLLVLGLAGCLAERPPKDPPAEFLDGYTLNGTIPLARLYIDDTNQGKETHFIYAEKSIDSYMKGARRVFAKAYTEYERRRDDATFDKTFPTVHKYDWIYYAMKMRAGDISKSSIVVFGSTEPHIETAALELGARHVTTLEYNNLTYKHPQITTLSKFNFSRVYSCDGQYQNSFDVAFSVSSFDHDGLGRYGDPLDPTGDLKAMSRAMGLLKPGGIMLLTVPIGPDLVVWNLLRRYGTIRLPLLLQGWEVVERYFWDEGRLTADEPNFRKSYEPVLILRKPLEGAMGLCDLEPAMVVSSGAVESATLSEEL